MSDWERRTSLLRCTILCHLESGRKEKVAGAGREKATPESLCERTTFLSALESVRKGFLPLSERKQEPFRHDPLSDLRPYLRQGKYGIRRNWWKG